MGTETLAEHKVVVTEMEVRPGDIRRLLIITLLDYMREPNARIHNLIGQIRRRVPEVMVLYGTYSAPGPFWRVLRRSLRFTTKLTGNGSMREVQVAPFLNYPESFAKRIAGFPGSAPGRGRWLRLLLEKALSTLGIVRDVALILSFLWAVRRHARGAFDVVLVQCPLTGLVGLLARRFGIGQRLVYDDIDYAPGWSDHALRRWWIGSLELLAMRRADRVISVGHRLAGLRESQTGRHVPVIPNGVRWDLFRPAQDKVSHPPTLIYMGRVMDWAGLEVVFKAVAEVKGEIPGLRLLVVGRSDPAYECHLRSLVADLCASDVVRFVGEVKYEDLPKYLAEADVGLATFRPNRMKDFAFPLKVVEYMASGLPVIGIIGTETARIIEEHGSGLVVEFLPHSVAGAIRSLLTERDLYVRYAANAARAGALYEWDRLMDRVYDEMRLARATC